MQMRQMHNTVGFDRDLIQAYLTERGLKYLTDKDGDCVVILATEDMPHKLFTFFAAGGAQGKVFSIVAQVDPSPQMEEDEALRLVNRWNDKRRWPRAIYRQGNFVLDWHMDLEPGISPALFADMCDTVIMAAHQFLSELSAPHGRTSRSEMLLRTLLAKLQQKN
jgi:hypothetical protein